MTTTDRRYSVAEGLGVKAPVRVATTASVAHSGLQVIDGVQTIENDRILDKDHADGTLRGIWLASSGDWRRAPDFDGDRDITRGTRVFVAEGSANIGRDFYVTTANPITIGTTALTFQYFGALGILELVDDTTPQLGGTLDTNAKQIRWSKGADVASANALTLGNDGNYFDITGTTAITSIATKAAGTHVKLHFDAALTLTHHAVNLILPSGASIAVAAGDEAEFVEYATGQWRCTSYQRAAGKPLATDLALALSMLNGTLAESRNANAVTFAIKTVAGNDPSPTDPVTILFRDAAAGTGGLVARTVTAALSLTLSAGSTLGFSSGVPGRLWLVAFDDGGTVRLGAINCRSSADIYPLAGWNIASSTAEGGAGGADSAWVFYTAAAVTSKAYALLAAVNYGAGLATAGNWDVAPSRMQLFGPGTQLPGEIVQTQLTATGLLATGTTVVPEDDTIPQITEGTEFMTRTITPTSGANLIEVEVQACAAVSAGNRIAGALFLDAVANALAAGIQNATNAIPAILRLRIFMLASSTATMTLRFRAGPVSAGTLTFNGSGGSREFGGVANSYIIAREIVA
jgi:hypothetical protein